MQLGLQHVQENLDLKIYLPVLHVKADLRHDSTRFHLAYRRRRSYRCLTDGVNGQKASTHDWLKRARTLATCLLQKPVFASLSASTHKGRGRRGKHWNDTVHKSADIFDCNSVKTGTAIVRG